MRNSQAQSLPPNSHTCSKLDRLYLGSGPDTPVSYFHGPTDFRHLRVNRLDCQNAVFLKRVNFSSSTLGHAEADGVASADHRHLSPHALFSNLICESDVLFQNTKFSGVTLFTNVTIEGHADFQNARFRFPQEGEPTTFGLSQIDFEDFTIDWRQLPPG